MMNPFSNGLNGFNPVLQDILNQLANLSSADAHSKITSYNQAVHQVFADPNAGQ
jgi:hypothetical protein